MIRRFKPFIITGCCVAFCLWWLGVHNQSVDETIYTPQDYAQDISKIYTDLGRSAEERKDFQAAIRSYTTALHHRPDLLEIYDRLGICYEQHGDKNAALKTYLKAMSVNPNFIETRVSNGVTVNLFAPDREKLSNKVQWIGQPLLNKTIYVFAEKGLGDTIQFCRFLPLLKQQGARVLFKPQGPLTQLLRLANLGVEFVDTNIDPATLDFDFYASLLSVPHHVNVSYKNIAAQTSYLSVPAHNSEQMQKSHFKTKKFKVGLAWQGDKNHINDKNRSVALSYFYDLARMPGVQCYSLQKCYGTEQLNDLPHGVSIINLDQFLNDFIDTAAAIKNLDLVITVDTAVAHLVGALGTPVWLLLPHIVDWRWLGWSEGEKSVWYESLTKFRQPKPGDWESVFVRVKQALAQATG